MTTNLKKVQSTPSSQPTAEGAVGIGDILEHLEGAEYLPATEDASETTSAGAEEGGAEDEAIDKAAESGEQGLNDAPEDGTDSSAEDDAETEEADAEEDETSSDEADGSDETRGWPKSALKRVNKLTAQKKELEQKLTTTAEENTTLKAELERTQQAFGAKGALETSVPLEQVWTADELQRKVAIARQIRAWAREHPEGATVTVKNDAGEPEEKFLTAEEVRQHLTRAEEVIEDAPQRQQFLKEYQQYSEQARQVYPELFDKNHAMYRDALSVLNIHPTLRRTPDVMLAVGDYLKGYYARMTAQKNAASNGKAAAGKAPVQKPLAPRVPDVKPAPKLDVNSKRKQDAETKLVESGGSVDALAEFMKTTA